MQSLIRGGSSLIPLHKVRLTKFDFIITLYIGCIEPSLVDNTFVCLLPFK